MRNSGLSLLKVDIHTHYLLSLLHHSKCPSWLASNTPKLMDFMLTYLTLWNHSITIWETTVSFPFLPWSSWVLHRLELLLPMPSFNSCFLRLQYLYWISWVLSKKQIFSLFPKNHECEWYIFSLCSQTYSVRIDGLELKKTTHLFHVLFLWWFNTSVTKNLTPS